MLRRQNLGTLFVIAGVAEILAFVAVVDWVGLGPALLLSFAASVLGLSRLRHVGVAALTRLRAVAEGRASREDAFIDGAMSTVGAVLLIVPGFLTDLVGLALMAPSCREWVKHRIGVSASPIGQRPSAPRASAPRTIELETQDWSRLDHMRRELAAASSLVGWCVP